MKLKITIRNKDDIKYYSPDSHWASFIATIKEILEESNDELANLMVRVSNTIKAAGLISFEPQPKGDYVIMGDFIKDEKWGWQFKIDGGYENVKLTTPEEKRLFLEQILTDRQVDSLYDTFEDPFEYVKNGNVEKLMEAKFIGEHTANRIISKFNATMDLAPAYNFFKPLGVTPLLINKLCDTYGSAENAIKKFKKNPYILVDDIKGVGFLRADEIALKYNIKPDDPFRIKSGIRYIFKDEANNNGSTWLKINDFESRIIELLKITLEEINKCVLEMIKEKEIYCNKEKEQIALMYYYDLECKIVNKLLSLQSAECKEYTEEEIEKGINKTQLEQGFNFTDEQLNGIKSILKNNVSLVTGLAGCVDCDTEYFNGTRWVRISEYNGTDKVLQYNKNGKAELVIPNAYIINLREELNYIHTKYGIDMCVSDNHNVIYESPKGVFYNQPFYEIKDKIEKLSFYGKILTTFDYEGEGINLSDDEIRFYIAVFADGSFNKNVKSEYSMCRFHLKKDRKKERLVNLIKKINKEYNIHQSVVDGYLDINVYNVKKIKNFPKEWYNCNKHQLKIIADEVMYWDGKFEDKNNFFTNNKEDADFIQFVYSSLGKRASIVVTDRREKIKDGKYQYKSIEYQVNWTDRIRCGLNQDRRPNHTPTIIEKYETKDGLEYCFNVPSHMLVLRRNNKIFITGNCGKTSIIKGAYQIFPYNTIIKQCAFSGQAAKRINEATGYPSSTIHRLLGWQGEIFTYRETFPLPVDVVILDEVSMVGLELFWSLIQAIPRGAKLIMLGDNGQLPPIGVGNLLSDLMASEKINLVNLTKIHRQAEKSAIITTSQKIRKKLFLLSGDFEGDETYGQLRDLHLCARQDSDNLFNLLVETFMDEYNKNNKNIQDVQIIVAQNQRVALGRDQINREIQNRINPKLLLSQPEIKIKYQNVLRVNDKIINRENHYDVETPDGIQTSIYNGSMGVVKEINKNYIIVDFFDEGEIVIPSEYYGGLELAYAITCHSSQGSQFKVAIVGFDNSSYILLSNEWLYTAITRAKKMCHIVTQTKALNMAVTHHKTVDRDTFLLELFNNKK